MEPQPAFDKLGHVMNSMLGVSFPDKDDDSDVEGDTENDDTLKSKKAG
jgi:hypothetical protein